MTYFISNYYIGLMYLYEIISIRKVISLDTSPNLLTNWIHIFRIRM